MGNVQKPGAVQAPPLRSQASLDLTHDVSSGCTACQSQLSRAFCGSFARGAVPLMLP